MLLPEQINSTAILIFSRSVRDEAAVKMFAPVLSRRSNEKVARYLIRHTRRTAHKTRLPVVMHFTGAFPDGDFGALLANAVEEVFSSGFEKVIVIGNDSPSITSSLLLKVAAQLEETPLVLGPCTDGGVYLIGMQREAYVRADFVDLPWRHSSLKQAFGAYALLFQETAIWLRLLDDIDTAADLRRFLHKYLFPNTLLRRIRGVLAGTGFKTIPFFFFPKIKMAAGVALLRGSPLAVLN